MTGASDQPRGHDAARDAEHQDQLQQALPDQGHDRQQQQQTRKSHPRIHESLHRQIPLATQESGCATYQHGDDHIERGRGHANEHGNTSPVDIAAQEVAPQLVGTHQMLSRRALQQGPHVHFIERKWCQHIGEDRHENQS